MSRFPFNIAFSQAVLEDAHPITIPLIISGSTESGLKRSRFQFEVVYFHNPKQESEPSVDWLNHLIRHFAGAHMQPWVRYAPASAKRAIFMPIDSGCEPCKDSSAPRPAGRCVYQTEVVDYFTKATSESEKVEIFIRPQVGANIRSKISLSPSMPSVIEGEVAPQDLTIQFIISKVKVKGAHCNTTNWEIENISADFGARISYMQWVIEVIREAEERYTALNEEQVKEGLKISQVSVVTNDGVYSLITNEGIKEVLRQKFLAEYLVKEKQARIAGYKASSRRLVGQAEESKIGIPPITLFVTASPHIVAVSDKKIPKITIFKPVA